ncbi:hypothetical protein MOSE0_M03048 [Monosporozyma servazzii]
MNHAIPLTRQHKFKDTFALFIVFLSFNHFTSLCLLILFIITTRINNLLANTFVTLFLAKTPSPPINDITHDNIITTTNVNNNSQSSISNHTHHSKYHSHRKNNRNAIKQKIHEINNNNNQFSLISLTIQILLATLARLYAGNYFIIPIENLAISIITSSLLNNPNDCLSYATSCSVLYAISLNLLKNIGTLSSFISNNNNNSITGFLLNHLLSLLHKQLTVNKWLPLWIPIDSKYIRIIRYYLSFHIVATQFFTKAVDIQSSHDLSSLKINLSSNNNNNNNINKFKKNISNTTMSPSNSNLNVPSDQQQQLSSSSNLPSPPPLTNNNCKEFTPYFTNIVKSIKSFAPTIIVSSTNELQSSNTTTSINNNNNKNNNNNNNQIDSNDDSFQNFTNQLYELKIDLNSINDVNLLKDDITVTTNLENFIRYLFKNNTQYIISTFWSIFVTLKTTSFEKKILNSNKYIDDDDINTPNHAPLDNNTSINQSLRSTENTTNNFMTPDLGNKKSVFNNIDPDSMALIAQNKTDDFNQLNLITTNNNIFNKKENDYKVCIIDIGTHTLTFHIENLTDGELIVLVNGLIWSEVSCALILEHAGEEYVVVSGLVPSCSYDIQFVNRLRHKDDYLICDSIVRTKSLNVGENNFGTLSNEFEKIDSSFPSYYHRKFLSPLLTLKHSILTTNANLIEERTKLKKTKKEVNKKLFTLRQEIDHLKAKIKQNETNDEKNAFKIENLKNTIQQNEITLESLEKQIKTLIDEEVTLEEIYLKKKDSHLKKELEFSKIEEKYKKEHNALINKETKLKNDYKQSLTKREKMDTRHEKLQKEVTQNNELFEKYKMDFVAKKRKERTKRTENRIREINDLELSVKALEQDVNRLEYENENMKNITGN